MQMKIIVGAVALVCALGSTSAMAQNVRSGAAVRHERVTKDAECRREAKAKHFGIHFVKRNRFIKDCKARRA